MIGYNSNLYELAIYLYKYISASFYGASYISYPLQEAKGVTDISLRFRTHLSDALLLLAAGKTDYCMVSISVFVRSM